MIQVLRWHPRAADPTLHVPNSRRRPHDSEVLLESVLHARRAVGIWRGRWSRRGSAAAATGRSAGRERAVVDWILEVHRPTFAAGVDEPRFPIVIRSEAPLTAVRPGWLPQEAGRRPADTERVVGRVDPVVHVPEEARFLVLDVGVAALTDAGEDHLTLVGHAVAVGVAPFHQVVGVGFARQDDAILERQDHAGRDEAIDEHRALVVAAVTLGVLPSADPADRLVLAAGVGVHHVADHLADVHASVAVELDERRADHVRLGGDELHPIAGWQHEARRLLCRRSRKIGRLRREVGRIARRCPSAAAESSRAHWRAGRLLRARAGHLVLAVHDRHVGAKAGPFWRQRQDRRERRAHGLGDVLEHQPVRGHRDVGDVDGGLALRADRRRHFAGITLHADRQRHFNRLHGERHEPIAYEGRDLLGGWRSCRALALERGRRARHQGD